MSPIHEHKACDSKNDHNGLKGGIEANEQKHINDIDVFISYFEGNEFVVSIEFLLIEVEFPFGLAEPPHQYPTEIVIGFEYLDEGQQEGICQSDQEDIESKSILIVIVGFDVVIHHDGN